MREVIWLRSLNPDWLINLFPVVSTFISQPPTPVNITDLKLLCEKKSSFSVLLFRGNCCTARVDCESLVICLTRSPLLSLQCVSERRASQSRIKTVIQSTQRPDYSANIRVCFSTRVLRTLAYDIWSYSAKKCCFSCACDYSQTRISAQNAYRLFEHTPTWKLTTQNCVASLRSGVCSNNWYAFCVLIRVRLHFWTNCVVERALTESVAICLVGDRSYHSNVHFRAAHAEAGGRIGVDSRLNRYGGRAGLDGHEYRVGDHQRLPDHSHRPGILLLLHRFFRYNAGAILFK